MSTVTLTQTDSPKSHWARLSDDELLELKISDLGLELENSPLENTIQEFRKELEARGLSFHPPCFLADEWFCPVHIPAIGIPFYLAHPRLKKLEEKLILEVEGGTKPWFMKLMRHETGHAYSYAYNLYKKRKWQSLFGVSSQEYPDTYRPRPFSRSYVQHLDDWYAQSHPDEDFAETFAVWLTPHLNWNRRYRGWKAFQKLEYVNSLMTDIAGKEPFTPKHFKPADHAGLKIKLKTYYARKQKLYEDSYPDFYDRDLKRIFTDVEADRSDTRASHYLKSTRKNLMNSAAAWTHEKKYSIRGLLRDLIRRCEELNLYTRRSDAQPDLTVSSYITTLVMNHLFTGKFKRLK